MRFISKLLFGIFDAFGWLFGQIGKPMGWAWNAAATGLKATGSVVDGVIGAITGMLGLGGRPPSQSAEEQRVAHEDASLRLARDIRSWATRTLNGDAKGAQAVWNRLAPHNQLLLAEMTRDEIEKLREIRLPTLALHIQGKRSVDDTPQFRLEVPAVRPGQLPVTGVPMPKIGGAMKQSVELVVTKQEAANDIVDGLEARMLRLA